MAHPLPLRALAARVVQQVRTGQSLSQCLPPALSQLPPAQRPELQALCFGTCRWFQRLQSELNQRLHKPLRKQDQDIVALLLVGLFQLRHSHQASHAILNETVEACKALGKPQLAGMVNAVLRAAQREGEPEPTDEAARYSHPDWLVAKLQHNWPEHWREILTTNNTQAPMTLRVNAIRYSRQAYLELLAEQGIDASPCRFAPWGIQLTRPVPVEQLPGFADGAVSVQDEAAQLCTTLLDLQPGQRLLDACAAPGGKTCAMLEQIGGQGEMVAIDSAPERLARVHENLERLDLHAEVLAGDAADVRQWWDGKPFDRILLDVPCSASGVIRRHPDIKLLRREGDISALATIQLDLLEKLWPLLAPGGRLLYATCSVFPQENSRIIQRFLKQHPDARLTLPDNLAWGLDTGFGQQLLPAMDSHDGFFYACLSQSPVA
ncbi:MAG: 16S rRNA (cytosine(967)-C(5))-methyltransferase RsmB [Marinobacter sp.]|nr:16S rRNA (cytosine(967)-C(5))-methyltransferase RsmB [Marinobacter sp.]